MSPLLERCRQPSAEYLRGLRDGSVIGRTVGVRADLSWPLGMVARALAWRVFLVALAVAGGIAAAAIAIWICN